jgi:hypothetical protein
LSSETLVPDPDNAGVGKAATSAASVLRKLPVFALPAFLSILIRVLAPRTKNAKHLICRRFSVKML